MTGAAGARARRHIAGLTGLRFLAALSVVLFHTFWNTGVPGLEQLYWYSRAGAAGVGLFFLLSGFVLFHVYGAAAARGTLRVRGFLAARAARVLPVYAFGLLLALPGFALRLVERTDGGEAAALFAAPLLLQAWHPATACEWNCPGWSLSAEAFFYLLFPLLAAFVAGLSRRGALRACLIVYAIAVAPALVYFSLGLPVHDGVESVPAVRLLWYNPALRLPEFALGVLLGRLFAGGGPRLAGLGGAAAVAAGLALWGASLLPRDTADLFAQTGLLAPLFALLVLGVAAGRDGFSRALATPALVRLGEASYALYIIHVPLWGMMGWLARRGIIPGVHEPLPYLVYLAVAIGGALALHQAVERPARERLRRWLNSAEEGRRQPPGEPHASALSVPVGG